MYEALGRAARWLIIGGLALIGVLGLAFLFTWATQGIEAAGMSLAAGGFTMAIPAFLPDSARALQADRESSPSESRIPVGSTSLYARAIGQGPSVIVLHGGPDFDHSYLLPDLDRLKDTFRLIYYDQRGRGRSAENVRPEDVTLASELDDLDRVRHHFRLDAPVLLGHSWGARKAS